MRKIEHSAKFYYLAQSQYPVRPPIGIHGRHIGSNRDRHVLQRAIAGDERIDDGQAIFFSAFPKRSTDLSLCLCFVKAKPFHTGAEKDDGRGAGVNDEMRRVSIGMNRQVINLARVDQLSSAISMAG